MTSNELNNPYGLVGYPTDPYSWAQVATTWTLAKPWSNLLVYAPNSVVWYKSQIYVATGAPTAAPDMMASGWTSWSNYGPSGALQCTSSVGPAPDDQTGACERSPNEGPETNCVNPCTRLANGSLAVNKYTTQCRVFPGVTQGGNATVQASNAPTPACPTVCPQACVELWESCPPGTAPLTTLLQTKTVEDLMSLTGPYLANGNPNPLWPANYAQPASDAPAIGGKPYTECYSYNTGFCELPGARQVLVQTDAAPMWPSGPMGTPGTAVSVCYATCPAGTFQDPTDPLNCLFVPSGGVYNPASTSADPVQQVFCNPQYFNPLYWPGSDPTKPTGIQKGCTARPLPVKQGSTCAAGTTPIINENFNLEWCLPDCPNGYVPDLTQSSCIATCQGSYPTSSTDNAYNKFLDYIDIYSMTNRCVSGPDCVQNYTLGRCPSTQRAPVNSQQYANANNKSTPQEVPIKHSSMNAQCKASQYRHKKIDAPAYNSFKKLHSDVSAYQQNETRGPIKNLGSGADGAAGAYGECPEGMVFGDKDCLENEALCYDSCADGYEPVSFCSNGALNCSEDKLVYGCRALCPSTSEGLGPWTDVDQTPLFMCEYKYPNGVVPSDPNLWISCPDDGRYFVLQSSPTDVSVTATNRNAPLCVRKQYLRQSTCPNGFTVDTTKGAAGACIQACDVDEVIVTLASGTVVCQSGPADNSRHDMDFVAVADSDKALGPFKHRVLTRKNFARSLGNDPNQGLPDNSVPKESAAMGLLKYLFIFIAFFVVLFVVKLLVKKKPKS